MDKHPDADWKAVAINSIAKAIEDAEDSRYRKISERMDRGIGVTEVSQKEAKKHLRSL